MVEVVKKVGSKEHAKVDLLYIYELSVHSLLSRAKEAQDSLCQRRSRFQFCVIWFYQSTSQFL